MTTNTAKGECEALAQSKGFGIREERIDDGRWHRSAYDSETSHYDDGPEAA